MNRIIKTLFVVTLFALTAVSCNMKETLCNDECKSISVNISAAIDDIVPDNEVKASIAPVVRLSWSDGDKVFVYDGNNYLGDLTVSLHNEDARYAYLGGDITEPSSEAKVLTCIYAKGINEAPDVHNGKVQLSMSEQSGTATPFVVIAAIDYSQNMAIENQLVNFRFATSVVSVNILDLANESITNAGIKGVNTACEISLSNTAAPVVSGAVPGTITTTDLTGGNGKLTYYAGIPVSASTTGRQLFVTQQTKLMATNFTSSAFAAGKSINVLYKMTEVKSVTGISLNKPAMKLCMGEEETLVATITPSDAYNKDIIWTSSNETVATVDENGKVTALMIGNTTITATTVDGEYTATCSVKVAASDIHPFVDIEAKYDGKNLSTLRWSTENLAITQSGLRNFNNTGHVNGDYFQFGAYEYYHNDPANLVIYDSFTSKKCGDASDGYVFKEGMQYSYYNRFGKASKYNWIYPECILRPHDDIASICWGEDWRIPRDDELDALYNATFWAFDSTDNGYYVFYPTTKHTAKSRAMSIPSDLDKNDALLFFPAADLFDNHSGGYLSSSTCTDEDDWVVVMQYWDNNFYITYPGGAIDNGYLIKPVSGGAYESGVMLDKLSLRLEKGETYKLTATILPIGVNNSGIIWDSANKAVASVDETGMVTAVGNGIAPIIAKTNGKGYKEVCYVTVSKSKTPVLPGVFSVANGKKVHFSQGNLQGTFYNQDVHWDFAIEQYNYAGNTGPNTKSIHASYYPLSGTFDLFGWSTAATVYGMTGFDNDTFPYSFFDWGKAIDDLGTWRTLSIDEWKYLFSIGDFVNDTRSGMYSKGVTVMGMTNCIILYPDGFTGTKVTDNDKTTYNNESSWTAAEAAGVVCLPAAGSRSLTQTGATVNGCGDGGSYWSSTSTDTNNASAMILNALYVTATSIDRNAGFSVRLVTDIQ